MTLQAPKSNRRQNAKSAGSRVRIFEADPDLWATTPTEARAKLRDLTVPLRTLPQGPWAPSLRPGEQALALLLLDGAINLETRLFGRTAVEILGPGDPLSLTEEKEPGTLPHDTHLMVIAPSRVAILDADFTAVLHRLPGVADELLRRSRASARFLRHQQAIGEIPNAPARLLLTLWHLADRWGKPGQKGVVIEVRLTHQTLASLASCSRETVGRMLRRFRDKGLVSRRERWLVLHGLPPVELEHLEAVTASAGGLELDREM